MELLEQLVDASTGFALKLYPEIVKQNPGQNVFISPFSVMMALAMVSEGARGETRQAIL